MKTLMKLIMSAVAFFAAFTTFVYFVDNMNKEKKYVVINDTTNEIY